MFGRKRVGMGRALIEVESCHRHGSRSLHPQTFLPTEQGAVNWGSKRHLGVVWGWEKMENKNKPP